MGLFAVVRANGAMLAPTIIFAVTMWILRVPFALLLKPWLATPPSGGVIRSEPSARH
jgi:Na+-driven multidrug efflux pump